MRVLLMELNRISSHLVAIATGGMEIGALTPSGTQPNAGSSTPPPRPTRKSCWTTSGTSAGCSPGWPPPTPRVFAHEQLLEKFDDVFSGRHDTDEDRQDLETLAAALKPLSTWHALRHAAGMP